MKISEKLLKIGKNNQLEYNFEKLVTRGYYFVDKTMLIKELLDRKGDVNLFTRPRRFGKTLNMSMLQYFFEDARDDKGGKLSFNFNRIILHLQ